MSARSENRYAAERFDVLEDELPRETCAVRGCSRTSAVYAVAGAWRTFYVCSRHRAAYRDHSRIVTLIRKFSEREMVI